MLMEVNCEDIGSRAVVCTYDIGVRACQGYNQHLYLSALPDKHRNEENLYYIQVIRVKNYWKEGGQFILDDVGCLSNSFASLTLSYIFAIRKLALLFIVPLEMQDY